jgi:hypothetical protein
LTESQDVDRLRRAQRLIAGSESDATGKKMDSERFDLLTKAFAMVRSRRRIVPLLAGWPAASVLAKWPSDGSAKDKHGHGRAGADRKKKKHKKKCKPQPASVTCNSKCGAAQNNCKQTVQCGPCPCSGESCGLCRTCEGGVCVSEPVGSGCEGGKLCCGSPIACVDVKNDAANCGGCGLSCPQDHVCRKAACEICVCPGVPGCFTTLQQAVDAALADDVIRVCEGEFARGSGTFSVPAGLNLTVIGAGANLDPQRGTILVGQPGGGSIVQINPASVILRDLLITGGDTDQLGGGVYNLGTLTMRDCAVTESHADQNGGGIANDVGGTLTLIDCGIAHNNANVGAGIYNAGTIVINGGSAISVNSAVSGGGGLANAFTGTAEINNTTEIFNNDAIDGAGIFNGGTLVLNNVSSVHDNSASRNGGGIANDAGGAVTLNNTSSIVGNDAEQGGGILNSNGMVTLNNSSHISSNDATGNGGGIVNGSGVTLNDSSFIDHNTAGGMGGGIYNPGTVRRAPGSSIHDNNPDQCLDVGMGHGC